MIEGESYADDEEDLEDMDVAEEDRSEATNDQDAQVPEDEDVEIHSLLLDEAAAPIAAVSNASPAGKPVSSPLKRVKEQGEQQFVYGEEQPKTKSESSEESEATFEAQEEEEEEEKEEEIDQSYIDAMDKRLSALTKNELAAQLRKRGEKAYGLKDELVVRLRNIYLREEREAGKSAGNGATTGSPPANDTATAKRGRGRPRKPPSDEQDIIDTVTPRLAKRRKVEEAATTRGTEGEKPTAISWPELVPLQLPRAFEPSGGWPAALHSLPDPATVQEWDLANNADLRNKVALLRLWVLSQPLDLEECVPHTSHAVLCLKHPHAENIVKRTPPSSRRSVNGRNLGERQRRPNRRGTCVHVCFLNGKWLTLGFWC